MQTDWTHFIGGRADEPAEWLQEYDPRTGEPSFRVARGDAAVVDRAVADAKAALASWQAMKPAGRGRVLLRVAAAIRAKAKDLSDIERAETGKPAFISLAEVEMAAQYFELYGGLAPYCQGESIPLGENYLSYTIREPFGVVGVILPWNGPIAQLGRGVAPALAAGNAVVMKPSEFTSAGSLALTAIAHEAGLPAGVLNTVTGTGAECGVALVSHRDVRKVSFTGSVRAGKEIGRIAAEKIMPLTLELGGKSPNIVFEDADLAKAAQGAVNGFTANSGQYCGAGSRVLVHNSIKEEMVSRISEIVRGLKPEAGEGSGLGPMTTRAQYEKVGEYLRIAEAEGARPVVGGTQASVGIENGGWFVAPTVYADVTNSMRIAREEVFGPVLSIIGFEDEAEAVAIANDSDYGLVAGLWTRDISRAHRVAARLEAGTVFVNEFPSGSIETPFGGVKQSGYGREKGLEALLHYTETKSVIVRL